MPLSLGHVGKHLLLQPLDGRSVQPIGPDLEEKEQKLLEEHPDQSLKSLVVIHRRVPRSVSAHASSYSASHKSSNGATCSSLIFSRFSSRPRRSQSRHQLGCLPDFRPQRGLAVPVKHGLDVPSMCRGPVLLPRSRRYRAWHHRRESGPGSIRFSSPCGDVCARLKPLVDGDLLAAKARSCRHGASVRAENWGPATGLRGGRKDGGASL